VAAALLELEPVLVAGARAAGTVGGDGVGVGVGVTAAAFCSRARKPPSSWMVLIKGAGKFDNFEIDVGFEQRHADFTQGDVNVGFGQFAFTG
jgi:hypothetical protein